MSENKQQDKPSEQISSRQSERARTVVVPRVQSMQDYILKHHKRMILSALNDWVKILVSPEFLLNNEAVLQLNLHNCIFSDMTFWRCDTYTLLVDVIVKVNLSWNGEFGNIQLYCELWVDMRKGMSFICGECGYLIDKPERPYWMLSEYLVPILRKDEIEDGAECLLQQHLSGAYQNPREHYAEALAQKMGLTVVRYPLHLRSRTRSILFFRSGKITVAQTDSDGHTVELPYAVQIPANTIVINTNAVHKDHCQLDIFHECIHYDWHFMFFRLQDMHHSDINMLQVKQKVVVEEKVPTNPLTWMEWQARRGSFGLMMPLSLMKPMIRRLNEPLSHRQHHAGRKLDMIARSISAERDWPRFRVRARLIQMGYVEAKGALNYVDGAYIEPFAFSRDKGMGQYSFVIDRENVIALYQADAPFRSLLRSGEYVYVDGHLCKNDPRYVRQDVHGLKLTPWANAHVDECCMRFVEVYEQCSLADYSFGELHSDEEYNRQYLTFAAGTGKLGKKEQLTEMRRILEMIPSSFPEALTFLMRRARVTIEQLEEKTSISGRTISRLRTEERSEYSLDQVLAICIALHLPPWLSRELLHRAGILLRRTKQHLAYQCILDCMFMDEVSDVQRSLAEAGLKKLKLGKEL